MSRIISIILLLILIAVIIFVPNIPDWVYLILFIGLLLVILYVIFSSMKRNIQNTQKKE